MSEAFDPSRTTLNPAALAVAMQAAIDAALPHLGATAPNPPVGCSVLDAAGHLLASAGHARAGAPHAEAAALSALAAAGHLDRAHTLVVTLEPCNHTGRTPPCTDAILRSPVRAVLVGAPDPDPTVRGHGAARLRAAGLSVHFAPTLPDPDAARFASACRALIAPFTRHRRDGRPWITVKQAVTRAGSMTPPPGARTFTTPASLLLAHRLRRATDAVVTGTATIRADDPAFTVRLLPDHPDRRPRPLAVLGRTPLPPGYAPAAAARGLDLRPLPTLDALLPTLHDAGVLWAMVEAGPTLLAVLDRAALWDDWLRIEHAPPSGIPADGTPAADALDTLSILLPPSSDGTTPLSLLPELAPLVPAIGTRPRIPAAPSHQEPACSPAS